MSEGIVADDGRPPVWQESSSCVAMKAFQARRAPCGQFGTENSGIWKIAG
jgi:hypothetical protein